jgi:hypothetical protein
MCHGIGTTVLLKENCYRSTDIHDPASRLIKADQGEKKRTELQLALSSEFALKNL